MGDILAVQSGEGGESYPAALYIIHWNILTSNFDITTIPVSNYFPGEALEKAAFAPVDIPPLP